MHLGSLKKNRVGNGGERERKRQGYWRKRSEGDRTGKRGREREGGKSRREGKRGGRDQEREGEFLKEIVISKGNLFTKRQTNGNQMVWTGWMPWYSLRDFKGPYSSFVSQVNH